MCLRNCRSCDAHSWSHSWRWKSQTTPAKPQRTRADRPSDAAPCRAKRAAMAHSRTQEEPIPEAIIASVLLEVLLGSGQDWCCRQARGMGRSEGGKRGEGRKFSTWLTANLCESGSDATAWQEMSLSHSGWLFGGLLMLRARRRMTPFPSSDKPQSPPDIKPAGLKGSHPNTSQTEKEKSCVFLKLCSTFDQLKVKHKEQQKCAKNANQVLGFPFGDKSGLINFNT